MHSPILSLSTIMGADIFSSNGYSIAILEDVVWNKDSGRVSYLIISPQQAEATESAIRFAIHHSYFYLDGRDGHLTFSSKIGKDDQHFFLDLPARYEDTDVQNVTGFNRYLVNHSSIATHRSDNDGLAT